MLSHLPSHGPILLILAVIIIIDEVDIVQFHILVGENSVVGYDHGSFGKTTIKTTATVAITTKVMPRIQSSELAHPILVTRSSFAVDDEPLQILEHETLVRTDVVVIVIDRVLPQYLHIGIIDDSVVFEPFVQLTLIVLGTPPTRIGIQRHVIVIPPLDAFVQTAAAPQFLGKFTKFVR